MTKPKTPRLPIGWVVVADRQKVLDQIQQLNDKRIPLGGVEIRLDLWQGKEPEMHPFGGLSVLVTDRGGIQSKLRTDFRNQFCQLHQGLLDVDPDSDAPAPLTQPWIFSCHRTESTAVTVDDQVDQARQLGAVAAKIVMPEASEKNLQIACELPQKTPDFPVVCFCGGQQGTKYRRQTFETGQPWGYAKLGKHPEQIPGLPVLQKLYCERDER